MDAAPHSPGLLLFSHDGAISPEKAEELLGSVQGMAEAGTIPRAAFRVFVELLQNIRLHGGAKGRLSMERSGECVIVKAQNTAPEAMAQEVLRKVADANRRAGELAAIMRTIRAKPLPQKAQGAGLGIYEVRRLACRDVEASILREGERNSGLVITVTLQHKSTP